MRDINHFKHQVLRVARTVIGKSVVNKALLTRNYRYYKDTGVIFVHIPKCAGSAVSHSLYGKSLGHWSAAQLINHDAEIFDRLLKFAVVRDPVERALSAWRYCLSNGTDDGWVKKRAEYNEPSFQDFNRFATEWLPSKTTSELDYVFQTQSSFVNDENGRLLVDRLISVKKLSSEYEGLTKGLNIFSKKLGNKNRNSLTETVTVNRKSRMALEDYYHADRKLYLLACEK